MRFEVEAILFDIDGTLVDSTAAVERIWKAWADKRDINAAELLSVAHGRRSRDIIARFLPSDQQTAAIEQLGQLELDDLAGIKALPGADLLLRSLAKGRWAAVTSGTRALMRARLDAAGLPVPLVMVTAEDVNHGKPDPEGYLQAAAALGRDVRHCLVVEDAPAGVEAGIAAGARVLGVATTHEASKLRSADFVLPDLTACVVDSTSDGLVVTTTT